MERRFPARLQGGPFDGDKGRIVLEDDEDLPDTIWADKCPAPSCALGGVHWLEKPTETSERYDHDGDDSEEEVYVWCDPQLESSPGGDRELVPAGPSYYTKED